MNKTILGVLTLLCFSTLAGYYIHVQSVELAIGARYEGCHEGSIFLSNLGEFDLSIRVDKMCEARNLDVLQFVK